MCGYYLRAARNNDFTVYRYKDILKVAKFKVHSLLLLKRYEYRFYDLEQIKKELKTLHKKVMLFQLI